MEEISNKPMVGSLIAIILFICAEINTYFWLFIILMGIDYGTGVVAAIINGTKSSKIGLIGIIKKIMYITFILFSYLVDFIILDIIQKFNNDFTFSSIGNVSLGTLILLFFIGNECISIIENFGKIGIKIPKWFKVICSTIRNFPNIILDSFMKDNEERNDKYDKEQEKFEETIKNTSNDENKQDITDTPSDELEPNDETSDGKS